MILAKDLRIGNKFLMAGGSMVQTVFAIQDNTDRGRLCTESEVLREKYSHLITCIENGNQYHPFEIDGVPLTEEWLLKLGFKDISKLHPTFKFKHYLIEENLLREGKYYLRQIINKTDSLAIGIELRYIHQLQNLYFALTGEELTIKP